MSQNNTLLLLPEQEEMESPANNETQSVLLPKETLPTPKIDLEVAADAPVIRLHDFSGNIFGNNEYKTENVDLSLDKKFDLENEMDSTDFIGLTTVPGPSGEETFTVDPLSSVNDLLEMTTVSNVLFGSSVTSSANFNPLQNKNYNFTSSLLNNQSTEIIPPNRPFPYFWMNDIFNIAINNHYVVPAWYLTLVFTTVILVYSLSLWLIFYRYIPRTYEKEEKAEGCEIQVQNIQLANDVATQKIDIKLSNKNSSGTSDSNNSNEIEGHANYSFDAV